MRYRLSLVSVGLVEDFGRADRGRVRPHESRPGKLAASVLIGPDPGTLRAVSMLPFQRIADLVYDDRRTVRVVVRLQFRGPAELILHTSCVFCVVGDDGDRLVDVLLRGYSNSLVSRCERKVVLSAARARCQPTDRRL